MASNLLAAPLLFFVLGALSRSIRSDLALPRPLVQALSIYLLVGIGLHGGAELARAGLGAALAPSAAALALAVAIPLAAYALLRRALGLDGFNAAAIAAHYGSVSIATFLAAAAFVRARGDEYEAATVVMLALMEAPAIVIGLALAARLRAAQPGKDAPRAGAILGQTLSHGSVVLLLGSLAIGAFASRESLATVKPFFETLFMGALCLFLVQMGIDAVARMRDAKGVAVRLVAFGVLMPLASGAVGLAVAHYLLGFSVGGTTLVATLAASASYIAVPPAMRMGVPEASPSLYLMLALGVTFPFNLLVGIPLFHWIAGSLA